MYEGPPPITLYDDDDDEENGAGEEGEGLMEASVKSVLEIKDRFEIVVLMIDLLRVIDDAMEIWGNWDGLMNVKDGGRIEEFLFIEGLIYKCT